MTSESAAATLGPANRHRRPLREPVTAQIASFVDLFVWLLVFKSFFLPLFMIPTGSMAETLAGAHATHTCPNCGYEYQIGQQRTLTGTSLPLQIICPNCRWQLDRGPAAPLKEKFGDRIVVHGWPFDVGGPLGPRRWDVVVFKNPNQPEVNYIKRLVGLPGEVLEVVDGDVFVGRPEDGELRIVAKSRPAQLALWMPYHNQDFPPRQASNVDDYRPRWVAADGEGWSGLDHRVFDLATAAGGRAEIRFTTTASGEPALPRIEDIYGYNAVSPYAAHRNVVTDVRVSAEVERLAGDGSFELIVSKYDATFVATFSADGRVALELRRGTAPPATLAETTVAPFALRSPRRIGLGHADGIATVEVDERVVLQSTPEQFTIAREAALEHMRNPRPSRVRMAGRQIDARWAHVRVDRDVHYTHASFANRPGNGVAGRAVQLRDDEYFVMGDNSPASQDSRLWDYDDLGEHLRPAFERGEYTLGAVPADQMIGRAFLVYWPGFLPVLPGRPTLLPDFGRIRWIH